jgi:hypothetical protein
VEKLSVGETVNFDAIVLDIIFLKSTALPSAVNSEDASAALPF